MKVYIYSERLEVKEKRKATEDFKGLKVDKCCWQDLGGYIALPVTIQADNAAGWGERGDVIVISTRDPKLRGKQFVDCQEVKSCYILDDGRPMVLVAENDPEASYGQIMQEVRVGATTLFTEIPNWYEWCEDGGTRNWGNEEWSDAMFDYGAFKRQIGEYEGELKARRELWKQSAAARRKRVRAKDALTVVARAVREAKKAAEAAAAVCGAMTKLCD